MTPRTNFENLRVYKTAEELSNIIWEIVSSWDTFTKDTLGKQIVRSCDSIGANIAEGAGRGSFQDNRRFVRTARGSLYETKHWLRQAFRRKLLSKAQVKNLRPVVDALGPMLNAYLKSIGNTTGNRPKLEPHIQND
jgi:four helix bundle protein